MGVRFAESKVAIYKQRDLYLICRILRLGDLSLPFGLAPMEATIDGYTLDHSVQALRRVYSVEATFGCEKRCIPGMKPGKILASLWVACSCQASPHWHEASGSENTGENASQRCLRGARGAN